MTQKVARLKVDPSFAQLVKVSAAISGKSILKYSKEIAKKNKDHMKIPEGFVNFDMEL